MECRSFRNHRSVFRVGSGIDIALWVRLFSTDEDNVGHQIHQEACIEFDVRVNGADFELAVFQELRKPQTLRTGESEVDLLRDAHLEQGKMLGTANARNDQVQIVDLPGIN